MRYICVLLLTPSMLIFTNFAFKIAKDNLCHFVFCMFGCVFFDDDAMLINGVQSIPKIPTTKPEFKNPVKPSKLAKYT